MVNGFEYKILRRRGVVDKQIVLYSEVPSSMPCSHSLPDKPEPLPVDAWVLPDIKPQNHKLIRFFCSGFIFFTLSVLV